MMITFKSFLSESAEYPIEETPVRKQYRVRGGLTKTVSVDAGKFKKVFEKDNEEKLDWNAKRIENLRNLRQHDVKINAYPEVGIDAHGRLAVNDGRHRISHAAELGMKIKVAVRPEDLSGLKEKLQ